MIWGYSNFWKHPYPYVLKLRKCNTLQFFLSSKRLVSTHLEDFQVKKSRDDEIFQQPQGLLKPWPRGINKRDVTPPGNSPLALRLSTHQVHASILGWSYCKGVEFVWGRKGAEKDDSNSIVVAGGVVIGDGGRYGADFSVNTTGPLEVQQLHAAGPPFQGFIIQVVGEPMHRRQAASTLWRR